MILQTNEVLCILKCLFGDKENSYIQSNILYLGFENKLNLDLNAFSFCGGEVKAGV